MADPQVLADIDNIKIPYPTEGVIRTAQLDDTVAPPDSAQLAVNMNFDRVGAIMTRPGVTSYADQLADAINNFGTLHNEVVPAGYANITQLGTIEDFQTTMKYPSAVKVSDTKVALFWADENNHGFAQNLKIDEITGDITPLGTPIEFESSFNENNAATFVSANLVMNTWTTSGNNGLAQAFDASLDQIAADGSPANFDSGVASGMRLSIIDANHFLLFYISTSNAAVAVVLAVDLSTGGVSIPGSPATIKAGPNGSLSLCALGDGVHFMGVWDSGSSPVGGLAQTMAVNLSTWAVTALSSPLVFDTAVQVQNAISCLDGQHFVNIFRNHSGLLAAQAFSVDLSTFAITTIGTGLVVPLTTGDDITAAGFNGFNFLVTYETAPGVGTVQMMATDPTTFDMSLVGTKLTGYDFSGTGNTTVINLTPTVVLVGWGNVSALDGQAVMFEAFGTVVEGRWLYAGYDDKVANLPAGSTTWTDRRTGLATVSKPRFAQFLNYIWMVNGNQQIGGDPIATSNGGDFGTTLVPDNFPQGDYIHGGFEGRVWVADATLGIIYYTDIVQFTPPNVYTLTYNDQVNFITTIAPQTGETFTGFCEVPRALLVFTQNTITRIYGAASIDAYPAYNVGTYSQESIINNVKNGIYFHHSSGFYQFTPNVYAAQPTEISRRIIDFVKAIPRENYENITGVYDGFDNVEWSVGPVTVEGVLFQNCVCRFTISTQVWTIYDYVLGNDNGITAMIFYDDGVHLNHLMGTSTGQTGQMDVGTTDFGEPFYFEYIDRWRAFTDMYYLTKRIDAVSIYHENAAGTNLLYQQEGSGPNAWKQLGAVDQSPNSIVPNGNSENFNVLRLRLAGTTKGAQIVIHGLEIMQITQKGQSKN